MNITNIALVIFIISLVPGDTFYGNLGLTQSLFIVPLLLVYLAGGKLLPENKILKISGLTFGLVLTIHLLVGLFAGIVEWYRTIGGLVLSFVVVTLFSKKQNNRNQIKWLAFAGLIPIISFYLGLWVPTEENSVRLTFLRHDPNHLGHLIIYGFVAILALTQGSVKINKIWFWPIVIICFIPLAYTFSRTSLISFGIVLVYYYIFLVDNRRIGKVLMTGLVILGVSFNMLSNKNEIIKGFSERFSEKNETRSNFNKTELKLIFENIFTGVGVSKFQDPNWRLKHGFYRNVYNESGSFNVATSTHNGLLDVFLIGGIFMFGSFLIIISFPAFFLIRKSKYLIADNELRWSKYLIYSFTTTFIVINLTYSLYNSKLGWWGIAFSYVLVAPYYAKYSDKFKNKFPKTNKN